MATVRASLILDGILIVVTAVAFSPALRHVLDHDQAEISLAHVESWPDTRNVVVRDAIVDEEHALRSGNDVLVPMLVPNQRDQPVRLVAKYSRGAHENREPFHGLLRDIWWEGLNSDEKKAFERHGVMLADDVKVLDLDPPIDLFVYAFVVGFVTVLMGIFTLVTWLRRRR